MVEQPAVKLYKGMASRSRAATVGRGKFCDKLFNATGVRCLSITILLAVIGGCSSPTTEFDGVLAQIKSRASQTREYMEISKGVYSAGPHKGERYETYNKTKWDWEVLGHDIRKTDSVTSPYTAVVRYKKREHRSQNNPADWQEEWRTFDEANKAPYVEIIVDNYTARFVYEDGQWKCLADDADFPMVDKPTYQDQNPDRYKRL